MLNRERDLEQTLSLDLTDLTDNPEDRDSGVYPEVKATLKMKGESWDLQLAPMVDPDILLNMSRTSEGFNTHLEPIMLVANVRYGHRNKYR